MPGYDDEQARYERLLDVPLSAPSGSALPAPSGLALRNENYGDVGGAAGGLPGITGAAPAAGGGTRGPQGPLWARMAALGLAAVSDTFAAMDKREGKALKTTQAAFLHADELAAKAKVEARKAEIEQRKLALDEDVFLMRLGEFKLKATGQQIEDFQKLIKITRELSVDVRGDEDRAKVVAAVAGQARKAGVPLDETLVAGLMSNRDVLAMADDLAPFLKNSPAFLEAVPAIRSMLQKPELVPKAMEQMRVFAAGPLQRELAKRRPGVVEQLRGKGDPATPVPLEDVASAMERLYPDEGGRAMANYLRGVNVPPEEYKSAQEGFARAGIAVGGTAIKVQEEKALGPAKAKTAGMTEAERLRAQTTPEAISGAAAKAGAVKKAQEQAKREAEPFAAEKELLELQKLRNEVATGRLTGLPENVQAALKRDPTYQVGTTPTTEQVDRAINDAEGRLRERARETSLYAASIPARTPEGQLERIEDLQLVRYQLDRMQALVPKVNLKEIAGGISQWLNKAKETGKVGPLPFPTPNLKPDQIEFLGHLRDYADAILRIRTGKQINEAEVDRLMGFLPTEFQKPEVLKKRLETQADLIGARLRIKRDVLGEGGYRGAGAPQPPTPQAGGSRKSPKDMTTDELKKLVQ